MLSVDKRYMIAIRIGQEINPRYNEMEWRFIVSERRFGKSNLDFAQR